MSNHVWLVPAFPLAAFILLIFSGDRLRRRAVSVLAVLPVGLSTLVASFLAVSFVAHPPSGKAHLLTVWTWLQVGDFTPQISFYIDPLSILMVLVVCFVSFFINLYSTGFMAGDEGYGRFFAYMNLFVGSMLILVLADDFLFLYLGWEAVGLCSYLLIGFWYGNGENGRAAIKSFVVTRIGDAALAIGLFVLFFSFGSLSIQQVTARAQEVPLDAGLIAGATILILVGAIGKSAQLPLHVWLPDAMVGPTPVSALIHAATMVAAGVYLIARTHVLFSLAPDVQLVVAVVGSVTLLVAGCSALVQRRIKRVLAYSTISQIGFMFLALGVGAWSAAIFHFVTHAFSKALLFLASGLVIKALDDEHDLFRMGGLKPHLSLAFWTFLVGGASLASLPFVTAGFYSKDLVIASALSSPRGGILLSLAGLIGIFLTALYTFRMVFLVFFGAEKIHPRRVQGISLNLSLVVLAVCSLAVGLLQAPGFFIQGAGLFESFLSGSFVVPDYAEGISHPILIIFSAFASLAGIGVAYLIFYLRPESSLRLSRTGVGGLVREFWVSGWGFDSFYDRFFVRPFLWLARINSNDVVDLPYRALERLAGFSSRGLAFSQTGMVRWYAMAMVLGGIAITGMVIFL